MGTFLLNLLILCLQVKKLTDFTNLFSPHGFEKNDEIFCFISKVNEIDITNLTNQTKFRLDEISKIEYYFHEEVNQRTSCSKKLSKYVAAFDCIDKVLIVSSATTGGVSIISFTSVVEASVGIASASFTLTIGIVKNLLSMTRNKKKKHDKILMQVKSKLNSIETLVSQALIDMELGHEEFIAIFKEKDNFEKMKVNGRNVSGKLEEKTENMRLNSVNSRKNNDFAPDV